MKTISMIAAIGRNREIGKGLDLLWRIPDDLKRFKEITSGHPVIMGKKTYESIGRPLPNRMNIVVSRDPDLSIEGATVVRSLEDAIEMADAEEIFIIGGGQMYAAGLSLTDKLYITHIDQEDKEADIYFPPFESHFPNKTVVGENTTPDGIIYTFVNYEK